MTIVYGGCVEPGGMELDEDGYEIECPKCQRTAHRSDWEAVEGGAVNVYWRESCAHCGYRDSNEEDDEFEDDDDRPPYPYELEGGPSYPEWVKESDEPDDDFPGFWQEVGSKEPAVGPEPMTAISGPAKAEWMTRDDLIALAQGRPLSFS
ncbi:hypothetical protein LYZ84_19650 [Xanthomonas hortorum pv. pelargonii]|uniref:Uncharacterized protein n=1 Tax=Xanthomonas hortorum pv. pelargonii TaxID=453602 RepID=A0A6V7FEB3_9XANT|nr:hypothetical protein [Xanthomonas hortorum]MCE4356151.1 hypothetical protein [Xanthomonas hortorum pv. pelargonii]NMI24102.1 hypothetical protein [Xanthomonas hortorum pv. pelargonii]CAD0362084.1 hypothetical protein CFBP2533_44780 [Xanthomonas hortorum pv. pelargonii]CAD0362089.1 hypothetical protein CFBP2533_44780 [Xanthomonas hortorum pv. pelargonii]